VFVWGQKHFGNIGLPPRQAAEVAHRDAEGYRDVPGAPAKPTGLDGKDWGHIAAISAVCCAIVWGTLFAWRFVGPIVDRIPWYVQVAIGVGILGTMVGRSGGSKTTIEWQRIAVIA